MCYIWDYSSADKSTLISVLRTCLIDHDFLKNKLIDRVCPGALRVIGREGQVEPLLIVLPIIVEPSNPRKAL